MRQLARRFSDAPKCGGAEGGSGNVGNFLGQIARDFRDQEAAAAADERIGLHPDDEVPDARVKVEKKRAGKRAGADDDTITRKGAAAVMLLKQGSCLASKAVEILGGGGGERTTSKPARGKGKGASAKTSAVVPSPCSWCDAIAAAQTCGAHLAHGMAEQDLGHDDTSAAAFTESLEACGTFARAHTQALTDVRTCVACSVCAETGVDTDGRGEGASNETHSATDVCGSLGVVVNALRTLGDLYCAARRVDEQVAVFDLMVTIWGTVQAGDAAGTAEGGGRAWSNARDTVRAALMVSAEATVSLLRATGRDNELTARCVETASGCLEIDLNQAKVWSDKSQVSHIGFSTTTVALPAP